MGEAFRFLNGLYIAISDNMPAAEAQITANGMDNHTGMCNCMKKKYVK
jgi:hypothetical protein